MSSDNENVMIIENEHEIHFSGIAMEKVVERSLQTKNNRARNLEEQMEIKLQQLHIQRKMWRGHNRNAFCLSFDCVNDGKNVEGGVLKS
jgi:hypothetical protein